jgi:Domain of unknown function (DUF4261)
MKNRQQIAELWYVEVPDLADPSVLAGLRDHFAEAEAQQDSITVPHPRLERSESGSVVPLVTTILPASPLDHNEKQLPDTTQTWDWPEADEALGKCTGSVLVSEMLAGGFSPRQRIEAFGAVLSALIDLTSPLAISWPQSQRVTDPVLFYSDTLEGPLNIRYFAVAGDDEARVMDSLGLAVFDLPDFQCHYREAEPAEVATVIFNTAVYLLDAGDVILDGDTISGVRGDERYVCRHEPALLPPARRVIDIDLGPPYAAGLRGTS